jgi:hypothetical protein
MSNLVLPEHQSQRTIFGDGGFRNDRPGDAHASRLSRRRRRRSRQWRQRSGTRRIRGYLRRDPHNDGYA